MPDVLGPYLRLPDRGAPAAEYERCLAQLHRWYEDRRAYNEEKGLEVANLRAIALRFREIQALNEQLEEKVAEIADLKEVGARIGLLESRSDANRTHLRTGTSSNVKDVSEGKQRAMHPPKQSHQLKMRRTAREDAQEEAARPSRGDSDTDMIGSSESETPLATTATSRLIKSVESNSHQRLRKTDYKVSKSTLPRTTRTNKIIQHRPSDRPHESCLCRPLANNNRTSSIYACFSKANVDIVLDQLRSWDGRPCREKEHQKYRAWVGSSGICLNRSVKSQGARRSELGVACQTCIDKRLFCWDRGESDFKTIVLLPLPEGYRQPGVESSELGYWRLP